MSFQVRLHRYTERQREGDLERYLEKNGRQGHQVPIDPPTDPPLEQGTAADAAADKEQPQ